MKLLPTNRQEMLNYGWDELDFVFVTGDAYVDHPSFANAVISRVLVSNGYRVGIVSQPDWKNPDDLLVMGLPKLAFLVSAGNMDSMVNHYTVAKKRRESDAYTPGGAMGKRPDNATVVYCNYIRSVVKNAVIIAGGIEASLRRLAHYDYWTDSLKKSVLVDSQADIVSYGMGEKSIVEIADALKSGLKPSEITFIRGTAFKVKDKTVLGDYITLPSYKTLLENKKEYAKSFKIQCDNTDAITAKTLVEDYDGFAVAVNPPAYPLTTAEMDAVYDLPYTRIYHPSYDEKGGVPAYSEVKFSLVSSRGCFGGCSFCALTFHQGRTIQARSHESIIREAEFLTTLPDFKGYIHDVGGPTANFRQRACDKQVKCGVCKNRQCLFPTPCPNLKVNHDDYVSLLRKLRAIKGVKRVFVRSGVRFDYVMADSDDTFLRELTAHHISGQLKVAPEHISDKTLHYMGKPSSKVYKAFVKKFYATTKALGKEQYLVPYLMSSHPGSTLKEAIELAEFLRDNNLRPEQVQDFYPTPNTISTCMYYTGIDPRDNTPVAVVRNPREKAMQRALIQYRNPANYELVRQALNLAGRADLIGTGSKCLIRPPARVHKPINPKGKSGGKNNKQRS
ncbi:MAG: YgiQ family radical SAM protein, partial [Clostridia bacterium]|nr:YgiQ family radical SAM protein [Clostridia bacterium]